MQYRTALMAVFVLMMVGHLHRAVASNENELPVVARDTVVYDRSPLEPQDALYRRFFSSPDGSIRQMYNDRWTFHSNQMRYRFRSPQREFYTIGTTRPVTNEAQVRAQMAQHVFRMRFDGVLRSYMAGPRIRRIRRVERKIRSLQNVRLSVPVSQSQTSPPTRLNMTYNLLTDSTFLGLNGHWYGASVQHQGLTQTMTAGNWNLRSLSFHFHLNLGRDKPNAFFNYQHGALAFETGMGHALSPFVNGHILTRRSLSGTYAYELGIRILLK